MAVPSTNHRIRKAKARFTGASGGFCTVYSQPREQAAAQTAPYPRGRNKLFRFTPVMHERNNTPLAAHFLRRFLAVYLVLSIVGLAAMAAVEYQRQRLRVMEEIQALTTTFGPVLGHAVWDFQ